MTAVRRTVDDGVDLAVVDTGPPPGCPEAPTIVLLHGFGGCKEDFIDQVEWLAQSHRVIAPDLRGHGGSDRPTRPESYSLDLLAADVAVLLDALGVGRFRLLGHSMGALVARRIVHASPDRVQALVFLDALIGSVPGLDRATAELGAEIARTEGMVVLNALLDELSPTITPAYRRLLDERPGYRELMDRRAADQSADMWASLIVQLADVPEDRERLAAISCPVLVLVGALDTAFLPGAAAIASSVPGSEFVVIPDAGHSPQLENGPAFDVALATFLQLVPTDLDR